MHDPMTVIRTAIPALAAAAALLLPTLAEGEEVVPPGNSAATQYTEAIPTAGGPKQTSGSRHHRSRSPEKVLGAHNAQKLDAKGPAGKAVAEIATETAPAARSVEAGSKPASQQRRDETIGAHGGSAAGTAQAPPVQPSHRRAANADVRAAQAQATARAATLPSGSSGVGAVLAKASGSSSSGGTGPLLLALVATAAWAAAFALRQRKRPAA